MRIYILLCISFLWSHSGIAQENAGKQNELIITNEIYAVAWNKPGLGLLTAKEYIDKAKSTGNAVQEAHAHVFMADCFIMMGDFAPAIRNLLIAREICDHHKITFLDQRINRPYGRIYIELGNPERAIIHQKEALLQTDEELEVVISSHSLAEAYMEAGYLDSALVIAEDLYERGGKLWAALPHLLGNIYLRQNKFSEALEIFNTRSGLTYDFDAVGNIIGKGAAYLGMNNLDSARHYAGIGLNMSEERNFMKYIHMSASILAESYRGINDQEYIFYLLKSQAAYNKMYSKEKMSAFNEFIFSDQLRKREMAEKELNFRHQRNTLLLGSLAGFLLLGGLFLWRNNLVKTKNNQAIKVEKEKVEESMSRLKDTQEQLIQVEKTARQLEKQESDRLRELNEFKSKLFTNITHEFRTPLTVILGMNDNITNHPEETSLIKRNAKNLLNLINQLLDLSKLDSGNLSLENIRGDIISFLNYLTESFYSMASDKKVSLSFDAEVEELEMDFDQQKVQHIIYNLLSNAIKFTNPGGKVGLKVKQYQNHGKEFLEIIVQDTGTGISGEDMPYIFDRFYQSRKHASTSGTGIGLALTRELVELMGGVISVKSEPGWGTEFSVSLAVKKESKDFFSIEDGRRVLKSENREDEYEFIPLSPDQISGEKPIILIVEDNEGVVAYIKSLLGEEYQLLMAMNGQLGIEMAIDHIPDLIITDVMMPEKNGYEVTEVLKKDEKTSHIPIIMLTARADIYSKLTGLEMGADAYLAKPFEKEELLLRVRKLLELRASLQEKYAKQEFASEDSEKGLNENIENQFLLKLNEIILTNIQNVDLSVSDLSKRLFMSHTQFYRKIKALTGKSPSQYLRSLRFKKAAELLKDPSLQVAEIAFLVGFSDPNYFSRMFKQDMGMTPGEFRS